jgi:dihydroorotate dehydrogenase
VDGWTLTNTTTERPEGSPFPKEGGLSGRPLTKRSKHLLDETVKILGDRKDSQLIVSVGGVMSPEEAFDRLRLGANLVQVYSALIFEGPFFFREAAEIANP